MPTKSSTRLGRPPASSSTETRARILTVARTSFAELGYGAATNKDIAAKAGITSGALYHYFDSKLDIYIAVYEQVQTQVNDFLSASMKGYDTFIERFDALLEASDRMNLADPSLARFLGSSRTDVLRHDELRAAVTGPGEGRGFTSGLLDLAIATGEIERSKRALLEAFVRTVLVGMVDALSDDPADHRHSVDSVKAVLHGTLLRPAKSKTKAAAKRR